ncbi:MAG: hypothetical protein ACK2VD_19785 [Anaerolineae bacterium]
MDSRPGDSRMVGCLLLEGNTCTGISDTHPQCQIERSSKSRLDATNQPTEPAAASAINRR